MDTLREFRGDSHTMAWSSAGLDAIEIGLLSDLFWGLAPGSHTSRRGWTPEQLAVAEDRLRHRGFFHGDQLAPAGYEQREAKRSRRAPMRRWRPRSPSWATTSTSS